jgi:NAD(P)-dependent dehydrogenase (short-subunit alcohol dehydrogenase family)
MCVADVSAGCWLGSVEHATGADWDRSAAINIKGHALLTKHVLPYMKAAGGGSIVWQGSISAFLAQVRALRPVTKPKPHAHAHAKEQAQARGDIRHYPLPYPHRTHPHTHTHAHSSPTVPRTAP